MSRAQAESVIKNIIREIATECATKGQSVSETLVAFIVKAVVLDPRNEFNVDRTLTKEDVQKLIKLCVDRLLDVHSPALDTVKMQVYFDMNYSSRGDFLEEHRRVLESRLGPVVREITDSRARTREELESLYRKIVSAILLRSGLGSPTDIGVVREATAALQSVFPQTELGTFMSLQKRDKERQLQELTMIVTGIRLFNKHCGKGGEGIDDLPAILNEAVPATSQNVESEMQETQRTVHKYTALLEAITGPRAKDTSLNVELLKQAHINCRQYEAFLRVLLNDVITCAQNVEQQEGQLAARLQQLQTTVQSKMAVPTAQVYPQFIHLSHIWTAFQDEMVLLSVLSNILVGLEPFTRGHRELFTADILAPHCEGIQVLSDKERIDATTGSQHRVVKDDRSKLEWIYPDAVRNVNKIPLKFSGYCGWTLVAHDRVLIPANPSIGLLHYKENYYAFSSKSAAAEFATDPDTYIQLIADVAKKSPELIQLLQLHGQFATITPYVQSKDAGKMIEKPIMKNDSGTQTDTHFMESNIVKSYEWNEWELRRKALKLANLRRKVTHSMQTNVSHMRRDNIAQTWLPKEKFSQTKKDGSSNVPKPSIFLAGLRGGGIDQVTDMTKVDLTLNVEDQL